MPLMRGYLIKHPEDARIIFATGPEGTPAGQIIVTGQKGGVRPPFYFFDICKYPTHTAIQFFVIAKKSPRSSHAGGDETRHQACDQHPESGEDKHGRQWEDGEYT